MNVLVTGHLGYIGAHLVDVLKQQGHRVTGCDLGLFDGCAWGPVTPPDREIRKDFRELTAGELSGHDAVMHLAAISNDPMGELDASITHAVNAVGSADSARKAKAAGVPRFLFSGSCSIYGKADDRPLDEQAGLNPLTAYARSKIDAERAIAALAGDTFSPVFLRNATAFGDSPMLRIDLVANNLLACAVASGKIHLLSDGTPWRPLIHCRDIARAFAAFLAAPRAAVHNLAVNVGADAETYRVRQVAEAVQRLVPAAAITLADNAGPDPRSYRVDFSLLARTLPGFTLQYTLESGLAELRRTMVERRFSAADFDSDRFVRLRRLRGRLRQVRPG